jgi:L-galactose dehydrogenase
MHYHRLGKTGLDVSAVSFGTAPLGDMFGAADHDTAIKSVHHALDAGINFFDSSPYYGGGLAEERLGVALKGRRDDVIVGTKAGRYGFDEFDFSPKRIGDGVHRSLQLLQTDYVDILQLHDIEFVPLASVFTDAYGELVRLRDEGKCRFIGMTGYPLHTLRRAIIETDLDVVLNYAHFTLLNTELTEGLLPTAQATGTAVINAAAVALGLLTPGGLKADVPVSEAVIAASRRANEICQQHGVDVAFLANQFSIQRSGCPTTVIGTTKPHHLESAVRAAAEPIDEDVLAEVRAATADVHGESWISGLNENN